MRKKWEFFLYILCYYSYASLSSYQLYEEVKMDAIVEIHQQLLKAGLTDEEADDLAARFLEEEAQDYVKLINGLEKHFQKENTIRN